MMDLPFSKREMIDRMRFLEACECELGVAEVDPKMREIHFLKASIHAAHMTLLKRRDLDADHRPDGIAHDDATNRRFVE
jgi:hypothetical protein